MNNKSRRQNRKTKYVEKQRRRRAKYLSWTEPQESDCILYIGGNNSGSAIVDSATTNKQIEFLKSKETMLVRKGSKVDIDDIILETREPVSLEQHKAEYGTAITPIAIAFMEPNKIHPEELKNEIQGIYLPELKTMTVLEYIEMDRKMRCDGKCFMADRPPVVVVTIENNQIVRYEFYRGHDKLTKQIDLISTNLSQKNLSNSYTDEVNYDVAKNEYWAGSLLGLKLADFKCLVELSHEALLCDYCKIMFKAHQVPSAA